ncbi:MAG: carbohydrate kinase family protein [Acidimicrobiales bacterium]
MACGAAKLGLRVAFVGVFGDDAAGHFMLDQLRGRGIDVSHCVVLPGRSTAICVHLLRAGRERDRAMISWVGCDSELTAEMVRSSLGESVRHSHVGSFYLLPKLAPALPGLFAELRRAGCTTSLDPQGDPERKWGGALRTVLAETDLFFPNRNEALAVATALCERDPGGGLGRDDGAARDHDRDDTRDDDMARLLGALTTLGPCTVVKSGADGAFALDRGAVVHASAMPQRAVDTIGAGDSFDAGFVYGFLQGWPIDKNLAFAVACGTLSTREAGGVLGQARVAEAMSAQGPSVRSTP